VLFVLLGVGIFSFLKKGISEREREREREERERKKA
jgi:hypothetical protein